MNDVIFLKTCKTNRYTLLALHCNYQTQRTKIKTKQYSQKAQDKIEKVMHEFKHGELKSGKDGKGAIVKSRDQAIAIGISEDRKAGLRVPRRKK